jgi:EAL domain-containing protein (putative c-di-GMP-specific phosphodiesterase class I)
MAIHENLLSSAERRAMLRRDLPAALAHDGLYMRHQPILELEGLTVVASEALVRWRHPMLGIVTALELVPTALDAGLAEVLDAFVVERTCSEAVAWPSLYGPWSVSINVQRRHLVADATFPDALEAATTQAGLDPSRIVLECEAAEMATFDDGCRATMRALDHRGVRFAIEGVADAGQIRGGMPTAWLKAARGLLGASLTSPEARAHLDGITSYARAHGMTAVAHGIETEAHLATARSCGFELGEGFLFSPPA